MANRFVVFDLETTGTDPWADRIVEIFATDGFSTLHNLVNPEMPIPKAASDVHGILDTHVAQVPTFRDMATKFQTYFTDCVLVGYNSRKYDTILLWNEFQRAQVAPPFDLETVEEIDVYQVWRSVETQNLAGAVKRWLGEKHENAHRALSDANNTLRVLEAMREAEGLSLEECLTRTSRVERQSCFKLVEGEWAFAFGKYRGKLAREKPLYLEWMISASFDVETKRIARSILDERLKVP